MVQTLSDSSSSLVTPPSAFRRMGDHGEQRPCRPAGGTLALLPVPDGFDRHAEPGREFDLRQAGTTAQVAHCRQGWGFAGRYVRRCTRGFGHRRRKRELLPVPQFDDPSVRFQPQALHVDLVSQHHRRSALRAN